MAATIIRPFARYAVFAGVFAAGLLQFYLLAVVETSVTDFPFHLELVPAVVRGDAYLPHPLFHWLTYGLSLALSVELAVAATLLCACALLAAALVQHRALVEFVGDRWNALLAAMALTIVTPIYVPMVNPHLYLGQLSPNVYHSPTYVLMKPLALIAFLLGAHIAVRPSGLLVAFGCGAALALSILAKPSFAMVFLPAIWILFLGRLLWVKSDREGWLARGAVLVALTVVSAAILAPQALQTFGEGSVGYGFNRGQKGSLVLDTPLRHWRTRTPSVAYSIAVALAFPAIVTLARWKQVLQSPRALLAWLMVLLGMLAYATLIDLIIPGVSNLGWSYMIGQAAVFLVAMEQLLQWRPARRVDRLAYGAAAVALSLHVVFGVYYYWKVALGYGYP